MEDPKRLLSAQGGASDLEREVLESVPNMAPPEGAKARAWEALAVQLAAASLVGAGAGAAKAASVATSASVSAGAFSSKIIAVVVVGAITAGGGIWAFSPEHDELPAQRVTPPISAHEKVEPPQPQTEDDWVASEDAIDAGVSSTKTKNSASKRRDAAARVSTLKRNDALLRESALLKEARAKLQAGDAKAAQASLDRLIAEFPAGILGQEREVLAISVLSAEGQIKRAQERARAFVKAHPKSPHSATLHELLERK